MRIRRLTVAATEPVTLQEAMLHLRVEGYGESPPHPDQGLIQTLITVARQIAEDYTGRTFSDVQYELRLKCLPNELVLPRPPVKSIDLVQYTDDSGVLQPLDTSLYELVSDTTRPIMRRTYNSTYPSHRYDEDSVRIQFTCGYSDLDSPNLDPIPRLIPQAILLILTFLYENRGDEATGRLPLSAEHILHFYRVNPV